MKRNRKQLLIIPRYFSPVLQKILFATSVIEMNTANLEVAISTKRNALPLTVNFQPNVPMIAQLLANTLRAIGVRNVRPEDARCIQVAGRSWDSVYAMMKTKTRIGATKTPIVPVATAP